MTINLVIDGKQVEKSETVPLISPGSGKVIDQISRGTSEDAKEAIEGAKKSFETWSETSLNKRTAILLKTAELLRERH